VACFHTWKTHSSASLIDCDCSNASNTRWSSLSAEVTGSPLPTTLNPRVAMKSALMLILPTVALCLTSPLSAQDFDLQLDHTNIRTADLERSAAFYLDVLQLEELETPWGKNPSVRFFSLGGNRQLHIAQVGGIGARPDKVLHLAFSVEDFDGFLKYLREAGIEYANFAGDSSSPEIRPDGVRQVYFQDPDGNWIEVNDAKY